MGWKWGEGGEDGLHLGKIIGVVGAKVNDARWRENAAGQFGKAVVDEAVFAVFALRPRVGKVNVQGCDRMRGQKPFEKVGGFDTDGADVGKSAALRFAFQLTHATKQPFHTNEVFLMMLRRVLREKGTIAAAQFHFQRLGRGKKLCQVEWLDN